MVAGADLGLLTGESQSVILLKNRGGGRGATHVSFYLRKG